MSHSLCVDVAIGVVDVADTVDGRAERKLIPSGLESSLESLLFRPLFSECIHCGTLEVN